MDDAKRTVLFDGVCNFCNGSVNFIIARDPSGIFRFASLQSEAAASALSAIGESAEGQDSVLLIEDGRLYKYSEASLRIAKRLTFPWSAAYAFIIVPAFIRDAVYRAFARRRYALFGKRDECMLPTPEVRERFLG